MTQGEINRYFDKVFVLTLKHEVEQRKRMQSRLSEVNIDFEFFEGVNGYSVEFEREWSFYERRPKLTYFEKAYNKKFIESRGAWGYLKTMVKLLTESLQKGYQRVLVFDNDVFFCKDSTQRFDKFYDSVSKDWKVLLLGASQYNWNVEMKAEQGYYHPIRFGTCGSFAIGYDRSVFYELIKSAKEMETPFDNLPLGTLYSNYKDYCFVAYPNLVIADVRQSSIRGKRDLAQHSKNMRWPLEEFVVEPN